MRLYDRDYTQLSPSENAKWLSLQQQEIVGKIGTMPITRSLFRQDPKAVRHYVHLFPNNYLDIVELRESSQLTKQLVKFQELLDSDEVDERAILNFINREHTYFIIASLLTHYHFGHHDAYLFPEFQLGNSYQVDYLLAGKGSGGWEFVFVELESPTGSTTLANGELGSSFRKGMAQIADWNTWLEAHFCSLKETFDKCKRSDATLPNEFITMDTSRLHYVVIAGRRKDFKARTYRIQREQDYGAKLILHYDKLVDTARAVIGAKTY